METDHAFYEIFRDHPEWLTDLTGRPLPPSKSAKPAVFKAANIECDLLVAPVDPGDLHTIVEFQFYHDASIFNRVDLASNLQWKRLNSSPGCRTRGYQPRDVCGFIIFGDRSQLPENAIRPHIPYFFLEDCAEHLGTHHPGSPLSVLLRPILETRERLAETAQRDYNCLKNHAALELLERRQFSKLYSTLLAQKFPDKSQKDIRAMIAELTPFEKTRVGKDLVQKGIEEGRDQERLALIEKLLAHGTTAVEVSEILGVSEKEVAEFLEKKRS